MDYLQYEDYLMHYGVKGMKWGVRKYQNADGTLTAKGKKRLAKNEAYRDKLVRKAQNNVDRKKSEVEEAEYNIKDLNKRGTKSEAYRKWKQEQYDEREYEYERQHKIKGPDGETYVKKYSSSGDRLFNEIFDNIGANSKVQDLIDENYATARRSRESAKRWAESKKELMNMEVSALTKKSEIRRAYRN